jgi:alanyl-tRNA synthetase
LARATSSRAQVAFTLYDTFGFPLDLTQDALRARAITVDVEGFNAAMERQREMARAAWSGSGEAATEAVWFGLRERVGPTEFLGYDTLQAEAVVTAILRDGQEVQRLEAGQQGFVVVNQTPFYGESGGQVGDSGRMTGAGGTGAGGRYGEKAGRPLRPQGRLVQGPSRFGRQPNSPSSRLRRNAILANHSATHLLHEALRQVLGDHVAQKGSLVAPDRLRFDFSHPKGFRRMNWRASKPSPTRSSGKMSRCDALDGR